MKGQHREIEFAIEVFVRGHSAGKSRTFPYEASRVRSLWVMRDAPRKNPRDYRKEEWIAHDADAREVDATARRQTRGRFFVCAIVGEGESDEPVRSAYKSLGYRLLATEGFFLQRLTRIPRSPSPVPIARVRTPELAERLGKAVRARPIANGLLGDDAPFRQYVALDGEEIVGRVRSVDSVGATWCADMHVNASHRRRGIGRALLCRMLRDDRARGSKCSRRAIRERCCIRVWGMSGSGRCCCLRRGGQSPDRSLARLSACSGEVDPVRRQGHAPTPESTAHGRRGCPL
jgi:GNAT superfamily N-acetyltransferase